MGIAATFVMRPGPFNKLSLPHPKEAPYEIWLQSALWLLRNRSLKILNLSDLDQGQSMALTFVTHKLHVLISLTASTNFYIIDYKSFWKIHCFNFFPYKSIGDQIWPCHDRSRSTQGHHLNKRGSTRVPNAAYKRSRSSAFWFQSRRIFHVFTIYGHGGHLGHVTWTIWTNFRSPIPLRFHMKFGFNRPSAFSGKEVW